MAWMRWVKEEAINQSMTKNFEHSARRGASALIMGGFLVVGYMSDAQAQQRGAKPPNPPATKAAAAEPQASVIDSEPPLWPIETPAPLPGAILPAKRIVAFYGNPLSKRMGILGQITPDSMLARLDREVAAWNAADPTMPVQPALHLIAVVANDNPGPSGKYRTRMDSALIEKVYGWARRRNALLFLDVQVGQGTLQEELPKLAI